MMPGVHHCTHGRARPLRDRAEAGPNTAPLPGHSVNSVDKLEHVTTSRCEPCALAIAARIRVPGKNYSCRRVITGSTREARTAGIQQLSNAHRQQQNAGAGQADRVMRLKPIKHRLDQADEGEHHSEPQQ